MGWSKVTAACSSLRATWLPSRPRCLKAGYFEAGRAPGMKGLKDTTTSLGSGKPTCLHELATISSALAHALARDEAVPFESCPGCVGRAIGVAVTQR